MAYEIRYDLPFNERLAGSAEFHAKCAVRFDAEAKAETNPSERKRKFALARSHRDDVIGVAKMLEGNAEQIDDIVMYCLDLMMTVPFDSFGPIDSIRAHPNYQYWSADRCKAVAKRLYELIDESDDA